MDYNGMTLKDLRGLCKERKIVSGGNKPVVVERLQAYDQNNADAGTASPSVTSEQLGLMKAKRTSGAGLSPVSPIKDNTAPLSGYQALKVTLLGLYQWAQCHRVTIECVTTLKVSVYLIRAVEQNRVDTELENALQPVLAFCKALDEYTRKTMRDGTITSSHAENFLSLQDNMTERIEEIITWYPDCLKDTSIKDLFSAFSNTRRLPDPTVDAYADKEFQQRQAQLDQQQEKEYELDMQRAIAASLEDLKQKSKAAVDDAVNQMQREIQEAYVAAGGDLFPGAGGAASDGQGDIPSDDTILSHVPEGGISFFDLTRKLNVHGHGRDILEDLSERVHSITAGRDGKIFPPQQANDLPSDQQVRETIWTNTAKMDIMDLMKILNVRQLPKEKQVEFAEGIFKRGVVVEDDDGQLVVKRSDSIAPTQVQGSGGRQSLGAGDLFANMPTFNTPVGQTESHGSPAKFGSAEHRPAAAPEDPFVDTPQVAATPSLSSKLPAEMLRVRAAVSAHLRNWKEGFPRPSQCKWTDLTSEERTSITRRVVAYIQQHDLIDRRDTIATTVQHFLHASDFPVKIGQNESAITAAVKGVYSEDAKKKKKQVVAQAESEAMRKTRRQRLRDEGVELESGEEEDGEAEDEESVAPPQQNPATGATVTSPRRSKRGHVSSSSGSGSGTGSPRARKSTRPCPAPRKRNKVVVGGDEDDDEE